MNSGNTPKGRSSGRGRSKTGRRNAIASESEASRPAPPETSNFVRPTKAGAAFRSVPGAGVVGRDVDSGNQPGGLRKRPRAPMAGTNLPNPAEREGPFDEQQPPAEGQAASPEPPEDQPRPDPRDEATSRPPDPTGDRGTSQSVSERKDEFRTLKEVPKVKESHRPRGGRRK